MRILILSCAAFLSAAVAHAQSVRPVAEKQAKTKSRGQSEIIIETGFNLAATPTFVANGATVTASSNHIGLGSGLMFKFIPFAQKRFTVGVRLAASTLRVSDDAYVTYLSGKTELVAAKYANPLLQIGLQGHLNVPVAPKFGLQFSPYAGYGVALSEKVEQTTRAVTAVPVGTSNGFNAGIDVSARVFLNQQLSLVLSSGYQRSWMRFSGANQIGLNAIGFNISHIPFNVGISIAL